MSKQIWISEREAMQKMGYTDEKYFRKLVKSGTLSISYRCTPTRRNYQYDEKGIERILNENSLIIHS